MKIATFENNILAIVAGTIAAEDIEPQFHALTHFPDRHAKAELADLAERLNQHDHPAREGPFQRRGHDCRRCGPYRSFRGRPTARMVIGVILFRGSQGGTVILRSPIRAIRAFASSTRKI